MFYFFNINLFFFVLQILLLFLKFWIIFIANYYVYLIYFTFLFQFFFFFYCRFIVKVKITNFSLDSLNISFFLDFMMIIYTLTLCLHFLSSPYFISISFNWPFLIEIDFISLLFILLTFSIVPILKFFFFYITLPTHFQHSINFFSIQTRFWVFNFSFFFLTVIIFFFFCIQNFFYFFLLFELSLLPMLYLIKTFGKTNNKVKALFYFLYFTLISSIPLFMSILYLSLVYGNLNFEVINQLTFTEQKFFYFFIVIPLAIKVPIVPFHIWLPEAHVEASTEGSVILASLLLKLGGFGFLKILTIFCSQIIIYYVPFLCLLCSISIGYSTLLLYFQVDLKKIVAYSSIIHMNYAILGLLSGTSIAYMGSIVAMVVHGFTSSGLFLLVGFIYHQFKTRSILYLSGLNRLLPQFTFFFFFFILSNIAFPGTVNFIGELFLILGIFNFNYFIGIYVLFFTFFLNVYWLYLFSKVCFGLPSNYIYRITNQSSDALLKLNYVYWANNDLNIYYCYCLWIFLFPIFFFGFFPKFLIII